MSSYRRRLHHHRRSRRHCLVRVFRSDAAASSCSSLSCSSSLSSIGSSIGSDSVSIGSSNSSIGTRAAAAAERHHLRSPTPPSQTERAAPASAASLTPPPPTLLPTTRSCNHHRTTIEPPPTAATTPSDNTPHNTNRQPGVHRNLTREIDRSTLCHPLTDLRGQPTNNKTSLQTLMQEYSRTTSESAMCVQRFDDSLSLQFALRIAFRCVLHRCESQDIHR
mmetsp:Transcript_20138/g.64478  ORF Transcript_20138/g.64478 Transcript_20138/m.64478 type:complete len:221 (+) Transcript_20138:3795-4457(+)